MLRFFRLIRKKLIEEQRVRQYTYYAIGEIFLVVIGILIALQINNWNEENKTRDQEKVLIISLKESVVEAGLEADRFIEAEESNIKVLESIIQNWDVLSYDDVSNQFRPFQDEYFSPIYNLSGYSQFYNPETDVYNTAVSDGSISIIQDKVLIQRLDRLYNYVVPRVNELLEQEYLLSQSINDHIAIQYKDVFLEGSISDSTLGGPDLWTDETYEKLFIAMRKDGLIKYKLSHRLELKRSRLLLTAQAKSFVRAITSE